MERSRLTDIPGFRPPRLVRDRVSWMAVTVCAVAVDRYHSQAYAVVCDRLVYAELISKGACNGQLQVAILIYGADNASGLFNYS